jgi:anti-sigma B factor antagonist
MLHFRSRTIADVVVVEFVVPGICDGPEIDEMAEQLHEMIGRSASKKMVIDLASVRFIASRALSLLISLKQLIDTHHGELLICGLREQVLQVFRLTGQDRWLSVQPNRDRALAALGIASA